MELPTPRDIYRVQRPKCRIAEIIQFTCPIEGSGKRQEITCYPIPRIFRVCSGQPAVEITKVVNIDMDTGEVELPPSSSNASVKGKSWREVVRYDVAREDGND